MKFLFTLFTAALIIGFQQVKAQSFEFFPNDTISKDSTLPYYGSVLEVKGYAKNTGTTPLTLKWKRTTNSGTQSITQSFCDNTTCYSNNFIAGIKTMDPIAPGDSGIMRLDLEAKCNTLNARVQVLVWVDGDSANTAKTMTYFSSVSSTADCLTATGIEESALNGSLKVTPNPAHNMITLNFASTYPEAISISDLSGRLVQQAETSSGQSIDISNLNSGLYFIQLGNTNRLTGKLKFIKQ